MNAGSFAKCLGGLDIVDKNLQLKRIPFNNCEMLKCLLQWWTQTEISNSNLECVIKIYDVQSEEARDLVFEFSLHTIDSQKTESLTFDCNKTENSRKQKIMLFVFVCWLRHSCHKGKMLENNNDCLFWRLFNDLSVKYCWYWWLG